MTATPIPPTRVSFFIDGFNLYHAIDEKSGFNHYKWTNYKALAAGFVRPEETLGEVFYFTSIATWNTPKMLKHRAFINAQKFHGVIPVYGKFKEKQRKCLATCRQTFTLPEEKRTDVNIAINLLRGAYLNSYDTAVIISGDSDLIPAVEAVKEIFPHKRVGVVIPVGRMAEDIKGACHFSYKMKESDLKASRLDDEITLPSGAKVCCPSKWLAPAPSKQTA